MWKHHWIMKRKEPISLWGRTQNPVSYILIAQKAELGPLLPVVTRKRERQKSLILTKEDG